MEKELVRLYEVVKKTADVAATSTDNDVEESRCFDALKLLKEFPVSYQILVATQVGKHLRVLTKHPRKKIRDFAMDLVETWKAIIIKETSKNKKEKVEKTHKHGTSSSSENEDIKGHTMEKELLRLYAAVKKAADMAATSTDSEVEENRCLDEFKLLKKFPVNYQLLVATQVGKNLRVITKHPRKKIRDFAMDLVEIWKAIVIKEINKNKKEKFDQEVPKAKKTDRNGTSSFQQNEKIKVQADSNVSTVSAKIVKVERVQKALVDIANAEKTDRNVETLTSENVKEKDSDVANMAKDKKKQVSGMLKRASSSHVAASKQKTEIKSNDGTREKIREILQVAFSRVLREADEAIMNQVKACDPIRVSVAVESLLFQKWGSFNGSQKIKYRSLMFNLKDPKNPDFRRRVLLGELAPKVLINMKTEDMASDKRKKEIEKIKTKALFQCVRGHKPKATTDQFKCGKCGKRECTYRQMQTRSADEPMTTYVTCVACNHHWKFC